MLTDPQCTHMHVDLQCVHMQAHNAHTHVDTVGAHAHKRLCAHIATSTRWLSTSPGQSFCGTRDAHSSVLFVPQCRPSKGRKRGFCWCVDKYGQPLPGYDAKGKEDVHCLSMHSQ